MLHERGFTGAIKPMGQAWAVRSYAYFLNSSAVGVRLLVRSDGRTGQVKFLV